ncbi:MAG: chemotaxis protein CheW [Eubacteriales bacterium]
MLLYNNKNFLEHMPEIRKCNNEITALNNQWDNLKLLCEINCPTQAEKILPNMSAVQNNFIELQQQLIDALITENLSKIKQKTISKSQVAIDVMIRNLYERTADVGFIATDDDIMQYVSDSSVWDVKKQYILGRLREYVAKYSVYNEIILLDKNFNIIINLDQNNPINGLHIKEPMLEQALTQDYTFTESFGPSRLQSRVRNAHIFTCRIKNNRGDVTGMVCLCFRFDDEMQKIFKKLICDYDGSVIFITDHNNTVLASSDENHIPCGIQIETADPDTNSVVYYRGIEYFVQTVYTNGYQGYTGIGWKGCLMLPLGLAFKEEQSRVIMNIEPQTMTRLLDRADSFSTDLKDIVVRTEKIYNSLKQIIFNGQLMIDCETQDDEYARLKPLLHSIGKIGSNTRQLFDKSIKNLFSTVISSSLHNTGLLASLCVDIMDRNLYERANDCRWWAMNPAIRSIMAQETTDNSDLLKLTEILVYINSLYTVYSNLFLFVKNGTIIAVSNPERSCDIGINLDQDYINLILNNNDSNRYFVSPYERTELYGGRYTYIYGASITDICDTQNTIGGIGIVFDSEFQFRSMLKEAIASTKDTFAVFTDRKGTIISSTVNNLTIGEKLNIHTRLLNTGLGKIDSEILLLDEAFYATGCAASSSYREYKSCDGYQNDVLAFVFHKLSDTHEQGLSLNMNVEVHQADMKELKSKETHIKLASFFIDNRLFALEQSVVIESICFTDIITLPDMPKCMRGAVIFNKKLVVVINTRKLMGLPTLNNSYQQIIIIRLSEDMEIALEIDELNHVLNINEKQIKDIPGLTSDHSILKGVICLESNSDKMLLLFNHDVLYRHIDTTVSLIDINKALQNLSDNGNMSF